MSVKRRDIMAGAAALATGAGVVGALRPKNKFEPKQYARLAKFIAKQKTV